MRYVQAYQTILFLSFCFFAQIVNTQDTANKVKNFGFKEIQLEKPIQTPKFENGFPSILKYNPVGTGRTTGHIITINIENPSDNLVYIPETPIIIPATKINNEYRQAHKGVFPETTISPNSEKSVQILGNCLDVSVLPVENGARSIDVVHYITSENMGPVIEPIYNDNVEIDIPEWEIDDELQKLIDKYDPNHKPDPYEGVSQDVIDMLESYGRLLKAEKFVRELAEKQKEYCENEEEEYEYQTIEELLGEDYDQIEKELQDLADKYNPELSNNPQQEVSQEVKDALDSYERLINAEKTIEYLRENHKEVCEEKDPEEDIDYEGIQEILEEQWEDMEDELQALADKYDPNYKPDPYEGVSQEVIDMLNSYKYLMEVDKWLQQLQDYNENKSNEEGSDISYTQNIEYSTYATFPGTDIPYPEKVDFKGDLKSIAPIIFEMDKRIDESFEKALNEGALDHLPLPKEQLKAELPQQVKWMVYANLSEDVSYQEEDLLNNTLNQFERHSGNSVNDIPEGTMTELKKGVSNIWSSMSYIGTEAKVLKNEDQIDKENKSNQVEKYTNTEINTPAVKTAIQIINDLRKAAMFKKLIYDPADGITLEEGGYGFRMSEAFDILKYLSDSGFSLNEIENALKNLRYNDSRLNTAFKQLKRYNEHLNLDPDKSYPRNENLH